MSGVQQACTAESSEHGQSEHQRGPDREQSAAPEQAGDPAEILFPPALLRRAARYISGAADLAATGSKLPDGIPETARNQLAATLRRDADGLIAITTTD
jgi:hypothetical protein